MAKRQIDRSRRAVTRTRKASAPRKNRPSSKKNGDPTVFTLQPVRREIGLALDALQRMPKKSDVLLLAEDHLKTWMHQIDSGFASQPAILYPYGGAASIDGPATRPYTGRDSDMGGGGHESAPAMSGHGSGEGGRE